MLDDSLEVLENGLKVFDSLDVLDGLKSFDGREVLDDGLEVFDGLDKLGGLRGV